MIFWFIRGFISYRLVWDPGDFTFYGFLVSRDSSNEILGDFPDDAWMIAVYQGCWSIRKFPLTLIDHM
jgi:hypothetical protein